MQKSKLHQLYKNRKSNFESHAKKLDKIILYFSVSRFIVFIIGVALLVYFIKIKSNGAVYVILASVVAFLYLVKTHEKYFRKRARLQILARINSEEIKALSGNWNDFYSGEKYLSVKDTHTADLDIFGNQSLYQKINRTVTLGGRKTLADWFIKPFNTAGGISEKQEIVEELSRMLELRQDFRAIGLETKENEGDYVKLMRWINTKSFFSKGLTFQILGFLIPAINIGVSALSIAGLLEYKFPLFTIILTLGFIGVFLKKINETHNMLQKRSALLMKYVGLLRMVEDNEFKSQIITDMQREMEYGGKKAHQRINDLARILQSLDNRLNMLIGILLNVYLMWDIWHIIKLDKWKQENADELSIWFKNISRFDAYCSLANLKFNEPNYVFPTINNEEIIEGIEMRHPLMNTEECVANDLTLKGKAQFKVVTGANMAGKSTYLRTVGTNLVLALMGSVVNAKSFTFYPVMVATSLRTTDSLMKNTSYFYAELKRLQEIIFRLRDGEKIFILLDEILKGTNSKDKEEGSIALLKQLIAMKGVGLIATHDLNLAEIIKEYKENIENLRFEADIDDDKLSFDYKLKQGIAQNLNATYLMRKMGITV